MINGLCLYDSLVEHTPNFVLHYLCLNDETYNKISSLQLPGLICYSMSELEQDDQFEDLKNNNESRTGRWRLSFQAS